MRIVKMLFISSFVFIVYLLMLWLIYKAPEDFIDVLEKRSVAISIATTLFGAVIAIVIATKIFESVKKQIQHLYSEIDHLKIEKTVFDAEKIEQLGIEEDVLLTSNAVVRYISGCILRERERLARIFAEEKSPGKIAEAIVDNSLDDNVFKWNGPETNLDVPPKSVEQRKKEN